MLLHRFSLRTMCAFLCAITLVIMCPAPSAHAVGPWVATNSYFIMDADSGQVLLAQNEATQFNPASITKIMTLGLACEKAQGDWSPTLTITHEDVHSLYGTDSSHIALQEGEVVSLEDALYATAMMSANDAANALATYIGGDIAGGVAAMNAKVAELGLTNTTFANPHGISESDHKTTAADMAVILHWALAQPGFSDLFCNREPHTMQPTNKQEDPRYFSLQDWSRINGNKYYVPSIEGSKTGYTIAAGYTYACLARENDTRLICVMLNSETKYQRYDDVELLLDYAFAHFQRVTITPPSATHSVSVYGGAQSLGSAQLQEGETSFLLFDGNGENTITASYDYSEQYLLGQPYSASVTYTLPESSTQEASSLTTPLFVHGVDALVTAHIGIALPSSEDFVPKPFHIFWRALAGCFLVAVLLFLFLEAPRPRRKQQLQKRKK